MNDRYGMESVSRPLQNFLVLSPPLFSDLSTGRDDMQEIPLVAGPCVFSEPSSVRWKTEGCPCSYPFLSQPHSRDVYRFGVAGGLLVLLFTLHSTNIDLMLDLHELWCRIALDVCYGVLFFFFHILFSSCHHSIPIEIFLSREIFHALLHGIAGIHRSWPWAG